MKTAYLALGSNVGNRHATIHSAIQMIGRIPGTQMIRASSLYETQPEGIVEQALFINAAVELRTSLDPFELMQHALDIEHAHGRIRAGSQRWGPRTLDIDFLLLGETVLDEPGLTLPHPRLHERVFVLQPLAEIAPNANHPTLGKTIMHLLEQLNQARSNAGEQVG